MKNVIKLSRVLFLAIVALLVSCNKDEDNIPSDGSFITASIDGVSFSNSGNVTASRIGSGEETVIFISGANAALNLLNISLVGITATGNYLVDYDSDSSLNYLTAAQGGTIYGTEDCSGSSGIITVTTLTDTSIEGTFSFNGKNDDNCSAVAKKITNGKFKGFFAK